MENASDISVEVVYAEPDCQCLISLAVPKGSDVKDVLNRSGFIEKYNIDLEVNKVGIYGRIVKLEQLVKEGDRVEIYRPLQADPKEVRRKLAKEGKTMGKNREYGDS